jgi:hypothetical protein
MCQNSAAAMVGLLVASGALQNAKLTRALTQGETGVRLATRISSISAWQAHRPTRGTKIPTPDPRSNNMASDKNYKKFRETAEEKS